MENLIFNWLAKIFAKNKPMLLFTKNSSQMKWQQTSFSIWNIQFFEEHGLPIKIMFCEHCNEAHILTWNSLWKLIEELCAK